MLENLKEEVLEANLDLVRHGLVIFTWGNVSAIDRASGRVVIKPSGVEYEAETGAVIVERFRSLDPLHTPGVLVKNHGPFAWGRDAHEAVYNATVLEQVAKMAFITKLLNPTAGIDPLLVEKHFRRKHGPDAYYGQK